MGRMDDQLADPYRPRRAGSAGAGTEYEYRVLVLPRGTSRSEARQLLTEHAEYGRWELARVRVYIGGRRKVWLRRRILRVRRGDWTAAG